MPGYLFVNFTAASRKPNLIPFGYFNINDSTSWIAATPTSSSYAQAALSGTLDGTNRVFTITGSYASVVAILRNGIALDPTLAYTLSGSGGSTVTFTNSPAYIPQPGDDIQALVSIV